MRAALSEEDGTDPELHFIFTTCCTGTVVIKEGRSVRRSQGGLTRVCPEVSCEGVPPPAGVATEGTFERFLPRVQLDVPQQVPLLGKRSSTLVTVEGAFTWKGRGRERAVNTHRRMHRGHFPTLYQCHCTWVQPPPPPSHGTSKVRGRFFCTMGKASNSDLRLFP